MNLFPVRFYFQVGNMEPGLTYTFHIINLLKKDSLYNYGAREGGREEGGRV